MVADQHLGPLCHLQQYYCQSLAHPSCQRAATVFAWQLSSSDLLFCACAHVQITMIVWQKLSPAREVLVEQEAGDVFLAGVHRSGMGYMPYGPMP